MTSAGPDEDTRLDLIPTEDGYPFFKLQFTMEGRRLVLDHPDYHEIQTGTHRLGPQGAERVTFQFIGGGEGCMSREEMMLHVVNHATYHRGQVASKLRLLGLAPPITDLAAWASRPADRPTGSG